MHLQLDCLRLASEYHLGGWLDCEDVRILDVPSCSHWHKGLGVNGGRTRTSKNVISHEPCLTIPRGKVLLALREKLYGK